MQELRNHDGRGGSSGTDHCEVTTTLPIGLDHRADPGPPRDLLKVYPAPDDVADKVTQLVAGRGRLNVYRRRLSWICLSVLTVFLSPPCTYTFARIGGPHGT